MSIGTIIAGVTDGDAGQAMIVLLGHPSEYMRPICKGHAQRGL